MTGGTWLAQNKIRPGAYINFVSVPKPTMTIGNRGIVILPLELSWGAQDSLIEVLSSELKNGESVKKVGFTAFDDESTMLRLAASNAHTVLVWRADAGGEKAKAEMDNLVATAKYPGKLGNSLEIAVVKLTEEEDDKTYLVRTYLNAELKDTQTAAKVEELQNNDWVVFSGIGELEEVAGEPLTGGTNGTVTEATMYTKFLQVAELATWQVMAIPKKSASVSAQVVEFIKDQRENEGKYVQAVVCDYSAANYEGVINSVMGAVIDDVTVTAEEFTAWVAGATAGASIVESNTGRVVEGATKIIGELTSSDIEKALQAGKFVLSYNQDGDIKVEQDINSYRTFTQVKNYEYSKNRIVRALDEIGTTVKATWERSYMGKINNNEEGRAMFKGDLIYYFRTLEGIGAVQDFEEDHLEVSQGNRLDAVVVDVNIMPVDSMEYLYMTVRTRSDRSES